MPLLLMAAALLVFAPSLKHQFILFLDDSAYLLANPAAHGFSAANIRSAFSRYFVGNYAPLHIVSYMLDYTVWGLKPSGFILTNIILHTANGILFYHLLLRASLNRSVALFSSLIFLLHPVQVEAVVWVSQRKTVLAMLFFLTAFHYYLSYRDSRSSRRYLLSLASFACAILSKSVAVILPIALLLHDTASGSKESASTRLKDKLPYIAIAAAGAIIGYISQDPLNAGGRVPWHGGSPWATLLTMTTVMMKYIQLIFWPFNLGISYSLKTRTEIDAAVALSALACLALLIAGCLLYKKRRPLFRWYALFFAGLLPVSQLIPLVTLLNDRYLYFPLLGLAPLVCALATEAAENIPRRRLLMIPAGLLMAVLALTSFERAKVWQGALTALEDIISHTPGNRIAWTLLAGEYRSRNNLDGLLRISRDLLSQVPDDPSALKAAGDALLGTGDVPNARIYLERYVSLYPEDTETCLLLAGIVPSEAERAMVEKICRENQGLRR